MRGTTYWRCKGREQLELVRSCITGTRRIDEGSYSTTCCKEKRKLKVNFGIDEYNLLLCSLIDDSANSQHINWQCSNIVRH